MIDICSNIDVMCLFLAQFTDRDKTPRTERHLQAIKKVSRVCLYKSGCLFTAFKRYLPTGPIVTGLIKKTRLKRDIAVFVLELLNLMK